MLHSGEHDIVTTKQPTYESGGLCCSSLEECFDDLEWHLKVIIAYVVIPASNIPEIIYDSSTETEIASKKSHDSFQVIRLLMTLVIFRGH